MASILNSKGDHNENTKSMPYVWQHSLAVR